MPCHRSAHQPAPPFPPGQAVPTASPRQIPAAAGRASDRHTRSRIARRGHATIRSVRSGRRVPTPRTAWNERRPRGTGRSAVSSFCAEVRVNERPGPVPRCARTFSESFAGRQSGPGRQQQRFARDRSPWPVPRNRLSTVKVSPSSPQAAVRTGSLVPERTIPRHHPSRSGSGEFPALKPDVVSCLRRSKYSVTGSRVGSFRSTASVCSVVIGQYWAFSPS